MIGMCGALMCLISREKEGTELAFFSEKAVWSSLVCNSVAFQK